MAPHAVLLEVAYDGTDFCGYQAQPGRLTVEGQLAEAVMRMNGAPLRLRAASRTDAGVHALAQPVAFDPTKDVDQKGWLRGLNERLPDAIRVRGVSFVKAGFEPRFEAHAKRYRYDLTLGAVGLPLRRNSVWHIDQRLARPLNRKRDPQKHDDWLDLHAMQSAQRVLLGTHDFAAFQATNDPRDNTVRTVDRIDLQTTVEEGLPQIRFEIIGNAFLKNMARIIVGSLVEVGRGKMTEARLKGALGSKDRTQAGPTAPARGLTLAQVFLK